MISGSYDFYTYSSVPNNRPGTIIYFELFFLPGHLNLNPDDYLILGISGTLDVY